MGKAQGEITAYAVYIGGGAYLIGVPARGMSKGEWDGLGEGEREQAAASGLYQLPVAKQEEKKEGVSDV